jgi:hypothetical protein
VWTPLSALPNKVSGLFPALTSEMIFWSLNLGPIIYIPVAPLAAKLLTTKNGMRNTVLIGLLMSAVCTALRIPCAYGSKEFRSSGR